MGSLAFQRCSLSFFFKKIDLRTRCSDGAKTRHENQSTETELNTINQKLPLRSISSQEIWPYEHKDQTVLLSRKNVNKGTKRKKKFTFVPRCHFYATFQTKSLLQSPG